MIWREFLLIITIFDVIELGNRLKHRLFWFDRVCVKISAPCYPCCYGVMVVGNGFAGVQMFRNSEVFPAKNLLKSFNTNHLNVLTITRLQETDIFQAKLTKLMSKVCVTATSRLWGQPGPVSSCQRWIRNNFRKGSIINFSQSLSKRFLMFRTAVLKSWCNWDLSLR